MDTLYSQRRIQFFTLSSSDQTGTISNPLLMVSLSRCRGIANAHFFGFHSWDLVHPPPLSFPIVVFGRIFCKSCSFQRLGRTGAHWWENCRPGCRIGGWALWPCKCLFSRVSLLGFTTLAYLSLYSAESLLHGRIIAKLEGESREPTTT